MKNEYNDNNLEQFLQEETNKHKMYPSDKLWRDIQLELHGKRSWPALTIIALFIISALTISTLINDQPAQTKYKNYVAAPIETTTTATTKNTVANYAPQYFSNTITQRTFTTLKEKEADKELAAYKELIASLSIPSTTAAVLDKGTVVLYEPLIVTVENVNTKSDQQIIASKKVNSDIEQRLIANVNTKQENNSVETPISKTALTNVTTKKEIKPTDAKKIQAKKLFDDNPTADDFLKDFAYEKPIKFKAKPKLSKFELSLYTTPSISYRKLVDDKARNLFEQSGAANGPIAASYSQNVNDVVRHKPALGTEVGVGLMYKISKDVKFKTGLQFNIRTYFMDSYKSGLNVATIAIVRNNRLDTVSQYTTLSANSGYASTQLNNKLFQISVPIGIDWTFYQGKRLGFSFGASVQPTLTLNKNVYLISTDYKYYTDGTPFFRKWNINTSAEVNVTYKVGNSTFSLGPQLRYQHLPTYSNKYPIKEYRMDYGIRLGYTKPLFKK